MTSTKSYSTKRVLKGLTQVGLVEETSVFRNNEGVSKSLIHSKLYRTKQVKSPKAISQKQKCLKMTWRKRYRTKRVRARLNLDFLGKILSSSAYGWYFSVNSKTLPYKGSKILNDNFRKNKMPENVLYKKLLYKTSKSNRNQIKGFNSDVGFY